MAHVYLGLGTNLGDKAANLHRAVCGISEKIGKVLSLSSFYETAPWGFTSENSFLNAAVCVETSLSSSLKERIIFASSHLLISNC